MSTENFDIILESIPVNFEMLRDSGLAVYTQSGNMLHKVRGVRAVDGGLLVRQIAGGKGVRRDSETVLESVTFVPLGRVEARNE